MKIAMLARNAKLYTHKRLKAAAEERGHTLDIINTLRCYMNIASHRPEVYYNGEKLVGYDAVIPRIGASITFYGTAVLRQFEMQGVYPLNESVGIGRSRDKLRSMQLLARDGIGLPVTTFAHDPKQTEEVLDLAGGAPVVSSFSRAPKSLVLFWQTPSVPQNLWSKPFVGQVSISWCKSLSKKLVVQIFVQSSLAVRLLRP